MKMIKRDDEDRVEGRQHKAFGWDCDRWTKHGERVRRKPWRTLAMTEQLDIDLLDADYDHRLILDLCDDPRPIAACGCRRVRVGG